MKQLENGWHLPDIDQTMTRKIIGDDDITNSNYEIHIRHAILDYIPIRNTFIDVGANVGVWSLNMHKHFHRVVAYEPSPMNIECFEANLDSLQYGANIELRTKAVGDPQPALAEYKKFSRTTSFDCHRTACSSFFDRLE